MKNEKCKNKNCLYEYFMMARIFYQKLVVIRLGINNIVHNVNNHFFFIIHLLYAY